MDIFALKCRLEEIEGIFKGAAKSQNVRGCMSPFIVIALCSGQPRTHHYLTVLIVIKSSMLSADILSASLANLPLFCQRRLSVTHTRSQALHDCSFFSASGPPQKGPEVQSYIKIIKGT